MHTTSSHGLEASESDIHMAKLRKVDLGWAKWDMIVMSWSREPVMWSWRHLYFNQTATKFLHTHFVDPIKLLLTLQFYDVRAYLWSASSRGHGGGFLWRQGKRP